MDEPQNYVVKLIYIGIHLKIFPFSSAECILAANINKVTVLFTTICIKLNLGWFKSA